MRTKEVKLRIKRSKAKRRLRHQYGPNWSSIRSLDRVTLRPIYARGPAPTVEEIRAAMRRANPPVVQPAYIEGVSPNA